MATIRPRGRSWHVYWVVGGRGGKRQSTTWATERSAQRAKKIAEAHHHRITSDEVYTAVLGAGPAAPRVDVPTLGAFADTWLDSKVRISPGTRGRYRSQLDREILPFFGGMHLDEIGGTDVTDFINHLAKRVGDATVDRYMSTLNALLGYAAREGKIADNPVSRTDYKAGRVAHDDTTQGIDDDRVYLEKWEFALIVNAAPQRWRPLLWFLVLTGARWSEATAVPVGSVTLTGKPKVHIHRAWKQDDGQRWYLGPTKSGKDRRVDLPPHLVEMLRDLVKGRARGELLFRSVRGSRISHSNFTNRVWLPAVAAASRCAKHPPLLAGGKQDARPLAVSSCGCPTRLRHRPTPHDLRHTYTSWLVKAGKPILVISRSLGHSSIAVTEKVYAHILPEASEGLAQALEAIVNPKLRAEPSNWPGRRVIHRRRPRRQPA